jgi:hypothetical protein
MLGTLGTSSLACPRVSGGFPPTEYAIERGGSRETIRRTTGPDRPYRVADRTGLRRSD